jgi:hypothetical protein
MVLPTNHDDTRVRQRPITGRADIEPLFFAVLQLAEREMQVAYATARGIALTGDTSIPLKEFM